MADRMNWTTIESDPGVFTELIKSIGVNGVQVEELYDLSIENLIELQPVHGLIFLFKWEKEESFDDADGRQLIDQSMDMPNQVFFAKQQVNDACATQAIVSVLLNRTEQIDIGPQLRDFLDFAGELPPDMKGDVIGNSDFLRIAHNQFARPEPFVFDAEKDEHHDTEDAFHFISYVPRNGTLYELDGLRPGPISLGSVNESDSTDWLTKASRSIERRIAKYQSDAKGEIRFNLLAIVGDREQKLDARLKELTERREAVNAAMSDDDSIALIDEEISELNRLKREEENKRAAWRKENQRRKHNYVPFIFKLLEKLAEKGKLGDLLKQSEEVTKQRIARNKAAKDMKKASQQSTTQ